MQRKHVKNIFHLQATHSSTEQLISEDDESTSFVSNLASSRSVRFEAAGGSAKDSKSRMKKGGKIQMTTTPSGAHTESVV